MPRLPKMLGALLGAVALALPASAAAQAPAPTPTGGLAYDDAGAPTVTPDGSSLASPLGELVGGALRFSGTLAGTHAGDPVALQRLDPLAGWQTVATTAVDPDGGFAVVWRPDRAGRTTVRAVAAATGTEASTATVVPARDVTVFRPVRATWYGPGFYGKRTACGQRLTTRLLGVAHRRLPCGTLVELFSGGRTVTVPVVDRGPFRAGASYDLTAATAQALGVTTTTTIGAVRAAVAPAGR